MSESKIVYVNEESDDDEAGIIYGAAPKTPETQTIQQVISPVQEPIAGEQEEQKEQQEQQEQEEEQEEQEEQKQQEKEQEDKEEQEEQEQQEKEQEDKEEQEEQEEEEEQEEQEEQEEEENVGGSMFGGDGYRSEPDDASSVSSLDTDAILNVDPLYFRLTKFLQTGGSEPENVAEILKKINTNLELMNQNLMNLMNAKSTQ